MCRRLGSVWLLLVLVAVIGSAFAQPAAEGDERERKVIEQLLVALEANPRRGASLDRVSGYHVERGQLDQLLKRYRTRTEKDSRDGAAWMLLGLLEAHRGRDAAAVAAFQQAEKHRPADALASYYLGQALVLVGQPLTAADAFERAIAHKPTQAVLLDAYQALGRVYQRMQRTEQALAVWNRLEARFPDNVRVQEQIAATLAEDGQLEPALARYQKLAQDPKTTLKQPQFRMEAADLQARLGRKEAALATYEALLADLPAEGWLPSEVRRKLEEVFLRQDDVAGLIKYYEGWLAKNPTDLAATARLAHALHLQGRDVDAQTWLDRALTRAPKRSDLRRQLIEYLVQEEKISAALDQYALLDKYEPNNPDHLREWGRLILRDTSRPEADRQRGAAEIWKRLLPAAGRRPDPAAYTQVADLFRQAGLVDDALALYRKAVELTPKASEPRVHLGEYLYSLQRPKEALAAWQEIAAGPNRTAANLKHLAEVLAGFGFRAEAVEAIAAACELEKDDFGYRLQYAELLHQAERYADALRQLDVAARLASGPEEAEEVLHHQVKNHQAAGTLAAETARLARELQTTPRAAGWYRLACYREAARQWPEAAEAVRRALDREQELMAAKLLVPAWVAAARIQEAGGNLGEAADAYRRLADLDRRSRAEHLTQVARLEAKLGRKDQALRGGRELLAAAPNNVEHYRFFANLCFQFGEDAEGLEALRRAVRLNPNDPEVLATLAGALADQFRTDEAIELFWRSFDRAPALDGKLAAVGQLAALYLRGNQFDRLLERLERRRRDDPAQRRVLTLCLAQAYQAAGDHGTARTELERLLATDRTDLLLLQQLVSLAEREGDLDAAVRWQQQLAKAAPAQHEPRLALLLLKSGAVEEAAVLWQRLAGREKATNRLLEMTDNLLLFGQYERALVLTERLLRERPRHWEGLYREGLALASLERPAEAAQRFRAILDLRLADDEPSELLQPARQAAGRATGPKPVEFPLRDRINAADKARQAAGLQVQSSAQRAFWPPGDFGQARMASLAWLLVLARKDGKQDAFLREYRLAADKPGADPRRLWDSLYLHWVSGNTPETYRLSRLLVRHQDLPSQWLYLVLLKYRTGVRPTQTTQGVGLRTLPDTVAALPAEELDQVVKSFQALRQQRPEWITVGVLESVLPELRRAKHPEEGRVYRDLLAALRTPEQLAQGLQLAASRGDVAAFRDLYLRLEQAARAPGSSPISADDLSRLFMVVMDERALAKAHADVTGVLDVCLDACRRQARQARGRPAGAATSIGSQPFTVGPYSRTLRMDYPVPGDHLDRATLMVLGNTLVEFEYNDVVSDLFAHVRGRLAKAAPEDRAFERLVLSALHWWGDQKEEAFRELEQACAAAPNDAGLRIDLAELQGRLGQPREALARLDAVVALDQATLQRRETAALSLAVANGLTDRARQAAERLFGLRLDTDTQVRLAGQMQQLGMHELAEAVLTRARGQAGNRLSTLVLLLQQYQAQNKPLLVTQVAHQVLRYAPPPSPFPTGRLEDQARPLALQALARSGRLRELIARTEAQLKASPRSVQLHQLLASYYRAAGDRDKLRATYERLVQLKPNDAQLRYEVADQLAEAKATPAALEHYRAAIKLQPSLFYYNDTLIVAAFQGAGKLDELAQTLETVDLTAVHAYEVMRVAAPLLAKPKDRPAGLRLLAKAWATLPDERPTLLSYLTGDDVWRLPEIYAYARQAVVPGETETLGNPWAGVNHVLGHLLAQSSPTQLGALVREVEEALPRRPTWIGGKALLAVFQARLGQVGKARQALQELLQDKKQPIPEGVHLALGQQLESVPGFQDLAMALYEGGIEAALGRSTSRLQNSPVQRLLALYEQAGRGADARALALRLLRANRTPVNEYEEYQRAENLNFLATQLSQLGYPLDAVRTYLTVLPDEPVDPFGIVGTSRLQAQAGLERALQELKTEALDGALREAVVPRTDQRPGDPAVDLVFLVHPPRLDRGRFTSVLGDALLAAGRDRRLLAELKASLDGLLAKHPDDFSVHVTAALVAVAAGGDDARAAVTRLVQRTAAVPLEALPPGTPANARQRAAAAEQLGLWVVARACRAQPALRALAEPLAERALEAARRQASPTYVLAMLREAGQDALDRKDRAAAERHWAGMVDLLLAPPPRLPAKPAPAAKPRPAAAPGLAPVTTGRFAQVSEVAKLPAAQGMHALALRAVREALRGGPPAEPAKNVRTVSPLRNTVDDQVERALAELDALWQGQGAEAGPVYEALAAVVFPEGRPGEIFLFPRSLSRAAVRQPASAGALLVRWAARAGRLDDLRRRIGQRQEQPFAQVPARVLLARLGQATRDPARTNEALDWLARRLEKEALQRTAELACHAGLPALHNPETAKGAAAVLERAVRSLAGHPDANAVGEISLTLARHHFEQKNAAEGRRYIQEYVRSAESRYGRVLPGELAVSQRRQVLQRIAAEYAQAGLWGEAWEALGQWADLPATPYEFPVAGNAVSLLLAQLATRPAAERYAQLKAWTLPTAPRKTVRVAGAFVPETRQTPAARGRPATAGPSGALSTAGTLIDAARELGKLDELAAAVQAAVEQKAENAPPLFWLVQVVRGQGRAVEPQLRERTVALAAKLKTLPADPFEVITSATRANYPHAEQWSDFLLARACLADPPLRATGVRLAEQAAAVLERTSAGLRSDLRPQLYRELALSRLAQAGTPRVGPGATPVPALWDSPAVNPWVAHEGHLSQLPGAPTSPLYFAYPLTGSFDFAFEALDLGRVEYGGLVFDVAGLTARGRFDASAQNADRLLHARGFNRYTLQVRPGAARLLINGYLVYEDRRPSPVSPWLGLAGDDVREPVVRNLSLRGIPTLPRAVPLSEGDGLRWSALPAQLASRSAVDPESFLAQLRGFIAVTPVPGWSLRAGLLEGRRSADDGGGGTQPASLHYHRPLRPGEAVRYEFFYEPDNFHVHPALGLLVFLLEPDGVRLRRLGAGPDPQRLGSPFDDFAAELFGLAADETPGPPTDDRATEPANRRGPERLPLKAGEWNTLKLSRKGKGVVLELNGVAVYERELEPTIEPVFGLYHDRNRTAARVRGVVLEGSWPEALPAEALTDPARPAGPGPDAAARRAAAALIGEAVLGQNVDHVLRQVQDLAAPQRYAALRAWVLPGDDHTDFRLGGTFTPTDPAPPESARSAQAGYRGMKAGEATGGWRHTGGALRAPALELVATARGLGKLDDLAADLGKSLAETDAQRRGRLGLLALIQAARERDEDAAAALAELSAQLAELADDAPEAELWPGFVAAVEGLSRPRLLGPAGALLDGLRRRAAARQFASDFDKQVQHYHARARWLAQPAAGRAAWGADPDLAAWTPVTHASAASRAAGLPLPHWTLRDGELRHHPGHLEDALYFAVPLRGNFEVQCELTVPEARSLRLSYGGLALELRADGKRYAVVHPPRVQREGVLNPPLDRGDGWFAFRLAVQDGLWTASVNGRPVHTERLPAEPDPWLVLGQAGWEGGAVRRLRVTGTPTVPEGLDLSRPAGLRGWLAHVYAESTADRPPPASRVVSPFEAPESGPAWEKRGELIHGRANRTGVGRKRESLLQYHRPLLEDGEIAYEFYYDPGRAATHPALDRLAFLLEPSGVRVHWLTDGPHERTGLAPDNVADEPAHRRGPPQLPLEPHAWNRVRLVLVGNQVRLRLNDVEVYQRPLEDTNRRIFGLFHYADETEVRVRGVQYRGKWPREVPPPERLVAAPGAEGGK
jgi:tetratricopeptide (TPR) repeat protein